MQKSILCVLFLAQSMLVPLSAKADMKACQEAYNNGSYVEAARLCPQEAENGNPRAQFDMGYMYSTGKGVPQDYAQAAIWFRKVAEQGNAVAQRNLGLFYKNGWGVEKNAIEATTWFRKAAEQGYASAQIDLGMLYYNGKGVTKDLVQAATWIRKAAEQGDSLAQYLLGLMYANGEGVAKDTNQAVAWYRKAAEQGQSGALNELGDMYGTGEGVPKNPVLRYMLYSLAVSASETTADENRDKVVGELTPAQLKEAKQLASSWKPGQPLPRVTETWIAPETEGRECGWSDSKGRVTILPRIGNISTFSNDVAAAESPNGLWGYVAASGKWVVPPEYDGTFDPREGFAVVKRDGKWGYINLRTPGTPPAQWFDDAFAVSGGLGLVEINGKRGYYDPSAGKIVIAARFDKAFSFTPDLLAIVEVDGKQRYIDRTGDWVAGGPWDDARDFSEGLAAVKRDGKWGYIDRTGKVVIPFRFDTEPAGFKDGLAKIQINGKRGFIDRNGEWIIPPRYHNALNFGSGRSFVQDNDDEDYFYLIDKTGKRLSKRIYSDVYRFNEGLAYVETSDGKRGLIDTQGRMVLPNSKLGSFVNIKFTDIDGKFLHEGKLSFCRDERKPEPSKVEAKPKPAPKPKPIANNANCRPNGPSIRCSSQCSNGDCVVTYENGCKIRVQVSPQYNSFNSQWEYPSPGC